jgi:hypothetical protein
MDTVVIQCPHCFEEVEIAIDPETEGHIVEDCWVCCRPWQLVVSRDENGAVAVDVQRA